MVLFLNEDAGYFMNPLIILHLLQKRGHYYLIMSMLGLCHNVTYRASFGFLQLDSESANAPFEGDKILSLVKSEHYSIRWLITKHGKLCLLDKLAVYFPRYLQS